MNLLHIYTGDGKGKTTAAMGLALRCLGHRRRVLVTQFMKKGDSGELTALRTLPNARVLTAPPIMGFTFRMSDDEKAQTRREQTDFALHLIDVINEYDPAMTVMDELNVALASGMVAEDAAKALIDAALARGEAVVTGRNPPEWLRDKADYLSVITPEKHPYADRHIPAREGIEF